MGWVDHIVSRDSEVEQDIFSKKKEKKTQN